MAEAGAWPAIRDHGLRTTRRLVDECDPDPALRERVLGRPRAEAVTLAHPLLGPVVVRDQGPLLERNLRLTDMTVREWLDVLNGRVFFWLDPAKLAGLRRARRYRARAHDVLTLDTAGLVRAHRDRVRLTGLNSGATLFPNSPARGSHTFATIADRPSSPPPVELAVIDGVADVDAHVLRVERDEPDGTRAVLLERAPA
jgi:hypothetical protein